MATTTPLNVLDELYLHLDRKDEPWTVHVEIRVDGSVERSPWRRPSARRQPITR